MACGEGIYIYIFSTSPIEGHFAAKTWYRYTDGRSTERGIMDARGGGVEQRDARDAAVIIRQVFPEPVLLNASKYRTAGELNGFQS